MITAFSFKIRFYGYYVAYVFMISDFVFCNITISVMKKFVSSAQIIRLLGEFKILL
jgi:hypothetical protein